MAFEERRYGRYKERPIASYCAISGAITGVGYGADLPQVEQISALDREKLKVSGILVSDVFQGQGSRDYRVAISVKVPSPTGEDLLLSISVPTSRIRDVMMPAVPHRATERRPGATDVEISPFNIQT